MRGYPSKRKSVVLELHVLHAVIPTAHLVRVHGSPLGMGPGSCRPGLMRIPFREHAKTLCSHPAPWDPCSLLTCVTKECTKNGQHAEPAIIYIHR